MDELYSQYSREDFYSQIYHHDEIYPPPSEADSVFLEIMSGCRYGKCLFCDFRRDKLEIYGLEDIERQLGLFRVIEDDRNRIHFLGCNPFFLDTEILEFFCEMVKVYLPKITEISMYARADDMAQNGAFDALTPMEVLKEEREMVSRINMTKPCRYIDSTVLQKYTVSATLPQGKDGLLRAIDRMIDQEGNL